MACDQGIWLTEMTRFDQGWLLGFHYMYMDMYVDKQIHVYIHVYMCM